MSHIWLHIYYDEVHGEPMFGIDFGGGIGRREVKVHDTELDGRRQFGLGSTQRTLQFESGVAGGESVA